MNDDIEILDIFDNNKKDEVIPIKKSESVSVTNDTSVQLQEEKDVKKGKMKSKKVKEPKKKRKVKAKGLQLIFCLVSGIFILGCIIFYGSRLIKYYRIFNPKIDSESGESSLASYIKFGKSTYSSDGDADSGLRSSSGNFIYFGDVEDNYLKFNNMLWRIIKVNMDNTIEIVLDDYITLLPWNKEPISFGKSDIFDYLKNDFMDNIDKDYLVELNYCNDKVEDLSKVKSCEEQSSSYVKLLDIATFLNSIKNKKTYLSNEDEVFWLTDYSDDKVWHSNGFNVSQSDSTALYEVRPVLKLKNTITYSKGDGTKDDPYIIDNNSKLGIGSIVNLDDDLWTVFDIDGKTVKLVSNTLLKKQLAYSKTGLDYSESTIKEYLNTTYLDELSYKDKLIDAKWYIGEYVDSIKNIKEKEYSGKVGIPNLLDIKFDNELKTYFLSTGNKENIYVYENPIRLSKITMFRYARPCIALDMDTLSKFIYEDGIFIEEEE